LIKYAIQNISVCLSDYQTDSLNLMAFTSRDGDKKTTVKKGNIIHRSMAPLYSDSRQTSSKWTVVRRNQTRTATRVRTDVEEDEKRR